MTVKYILNIIYEYMYEYMYEDYLRIILKIEQF